MTILKIRDLTTLTTVKLFSKLREHELEMNTLKKQDNGDRNVRELALIFAAQNEENSEDNTSDYSDAETKYVNQEVQQISGEERKREELATKMVQQKM